MSAAEQILDFLRSNPGGQTAEAIRAACDRSQSTVFNALSLLAQMGEITRVAAGVYALTASPKEMKPAPAPVVTPIYESEEPTAAEDAGSPLELPESLQMGIWSTGELTLARGEQTILLAPAEVREMVQFLDRVGAVPAAAVDDAT